MYKVISDGYTIYDYRSEKYPIFDARLELELNKTGTFSFSIYPDHPHFEKIRKMGSVIEVFQNEELVYRGRVLDEEQGFYNEKQVTCEGELAFLLDSVVDVEGSSDSPITYKPKAYLEKLIARHNAVMGDDTRKRFKLGNVSDSLNEIDIKISESDYKSPWELITSNLIDTVGGYIWLRYEVEDGENVSYIDYLAEPDVPSNQPIVFGLNLLDLKKTTKGEDVMTGIFPVGTYDGGQITLGDGGYDLDEETGEKKSNTIGCIVLKHASENIGRIVKTVKFDGVKTVSDLKKKAEEYVLNAAKFSTCVELTAADLAGIKKGVNPFRLGQKLVVKDNVVNDKNHGLEELAEESGAELKFLVKKLSLELLNPTNNRLTVGATFSTLTESSNASAASQSKTAETVQRLENSQSLYATLGDLENYYTKAETDENFATQTDLTDSVQNLSDKYDKAIAELVARIESLETPDSGESETT